jgi:hypothetical protein
VILQRRSARRWIGVKKGRVRGRSVTLRFKPPKVGSLRLRAVLVTGRRPSISPAITLRVRPAR